MSISTDTERVQDLTSLRHNSAASVYILNASSKLSCSSSSIASSIRNRARSSPSWGHTNSYDTSVKHQVIMFSQLYTRLPPNVQHQHITFKQQSTKLDWRAMLPGFVAVTLWLALPQSISRNSVLLSAKSRSANVYAHPPTATSVFHVSQQIDMASEHLLCPAYSFGTSCRLLQEPLVPTHRTASNSTEGVAVSLSSRRHVADHSTSEELS